MKILDNSMSVGGDYSTNLHVLTFRGKDKTCVELCILAK